MFLTIAFFLIIC
uniref:Uncharacterized protein n=1 Tax=Arundo donax TaxID=35708 RepID=A0A0A8YA55_ARUDO